MAFKVIVELEQSQIEQLAEMETHRQTYQDIIRALIGYAVQHSLQLNANGELTCGDLCLKAAFPTMGCFKSDSLHKPVHLDQCTLDVHGKPSIPSRSVLEGLYPPAEFEEVETYACHELYLWQIDQARILKAEVIGYIGQNVWVALKRRPQHAPERKPHANG